MNDAEELRLAEAEAMLDAALSAVAHDRSGHLGTIRNAAYYLRLRLKQDPARSDPALEQSLDMIDRAVLAIDDADGVRVGSRTATPGNAEATDAVSRATASCRIPPVAIETAVEPALLRVRPALLCVALRAVLENAAEAGANAIRITGRRNNALYVFSIADSGGGLQRISPEKAIQPFVSTKPGHLGMGLAMAHWICREAGGRLDIATSPGSTQVELAFPLFQEALP